MFSPAVPPRLTLVGVHLASCYHSSVTGNGRRTRINLLRAQHELQLPYWFSDQLRGDFQRVCRVCFHQSQTLWYGATVYSSPSLLLCSKV